MTGEALQWFAMALLGLQVWKLTSGQLEKSDLDPMRQLLEEIRRKM